MGIEGIEAMGCHALRGVWRDRQSRCSQQCAEGHEEFEKRYPIKKVKGKHGEPTAWDGLSTLFLLLMEEQKGLMTSTERAWVKALSA
jgi:hypothetical protein